MDLEVEINKILFTAEFFFFFFFENPKYSRRLRLKLRSATKGRLVEAPRILTYSQHANYWERKIRRKPFLPCHCHSSHLNTKPKSPSPPPLHYSRTHTHRKGRRETAAVALWVAPSSISRDKAQPKKQFPSRHNFKWVKHSVDSSGVFRSN